MSTTSDYLSRRLGDLRCEIAANRNTARRLELEHERMAAELREVEAAWGAVDGLDAEESEPGLSAPTDGIERANQELARFGLRGITEGNCLTCPGGHGKHKVGGEYPELPHDVVLETNPETNENEEA